MRYAGCVAGLLSLAVSVLADDFSAPDSKSNPLRLWYSTPASLWNDSLPIGNGRLGGMVRGVVATELISLNEDSVWSGGPLDRLNPDASATLDVVRPLLLQGQISDATFESNLGLTGLPSSMREFMPAGDLQIAFQGQSSATQYERWLDLSDGTAGVYYKAGSVTYKREFLASTPAGVMGIRLTASVPGSLSFFIKIQRPSNQQNRFAESAKAENGDTIVTTFKSNQIEAVIGAQVHIEGGSKRQIGDQIVVSKADEAWIYVDVESSVRTKCPGTALRKKLAAAIASTYPDIRAAHVADYQRLFGRTSLTLGTSSDAQKALSTDARRQALSSGAFDPELVSLYFQFGRYLLISSSRPGTYPANLQGVWNNDMNPAWGSKYTININIQMNYWPAEVTNLAELTEPLFSLMEKLYESGKITAKQMYGASGWLAHHNTDIWGDTAPQDVYAAGAYWPLGGAWLLSHVYEHYRFGGDKEFLKKYYDMLSDSALFFTDFLSDYKGWKVTNPSVSPENSYKNGSISGAMTIGSTIDNSILWELFSNLIEATDVLSLPKSDLITTVETLKSKLPPLRISPTTGALMEWIEDFVESDPGHRHMSPLYGLFPSNEITPADPDIWKAAQALVDRRLSNGSGNVGWSRAWMAVLNARLLRGKSVESDINVLLYNLTYNSLLDSGPPAGFQIDGNFGGCAAIAESLLQSHNGVVRILPALMPSAKSGSFKGLVARGGFVVDAAWENGVFTSATILSRLGGNINITIGTGQMSTLQGQGFTATNSTGSQYLAFTTSPGMNYTIIGSKVTT
ncbi:hypothetical protein GQ53DRAFT_866038 [Thozetella sp. PMI_491]|nr:hypothetical protein GQ53DRAFT_866038 [Thozetella sp. PMI_491]